MNSTDSNSFARKLDEHSLPLRHTKTEILQINVGKLCNLTCIHCHVNAGPKRKEIMTRETIDRVIDWLAQTDVPTVDLTGGAPEMIPDFKYLVERWYSPPHHRSRNYDLLDQTLKTRGISHPARIEIIASMPCS
jgi:sulfatase maturation enzyme AslB (radical SAM superfamily)